MSTKVEAPQPTPEQVESQRLSNEALQRSARQSEALQPFLLSELGLRETEVGGFERIPEDIRLAGLGESERLAEENKLLQQERLGKALRGELDVSEGTAQLRESEWEQLQEQLDRRGSTGTVRIQAEDQFNRRWDARVDAERRGEITTGTQLSLSRLGLEEGITSGTFGRVGTAPQFGLPVASALQAGGAPTGFQQMGFQADLQSAANRAGLISSAFGAAGTGAGLYTGLR